MRDMGKFRGKKLDNGEWVEGDLLHGYYGENTVAIASEELNCTFTVDPATVGEYSGMHDNTKWEKLIPKERADWLRGHTHEEWAGRKIYEGDICAVTNPNGEKEENHIVEYSQNAACYPYGPEGGFDDYDVTAMGWAADMGYVFEVIGTIFDKEATK